MDEGGVNRGVAVQVSGMFLEFARRRSRVVGGAVSLGRV